MLRAAVLLSLAACAVLPSPDGGDRGRQGGWGPEEGGAIRLTASAPRALWAISRAVVAERPPLLEVEVPEVENPARTPFGLRLALRTGEEDGPAEAVIGHVTLHPADRPARFLVRASDAWARLDPEEGEPVRLLVELRAVQEGELGDLAVTVGPLVWRAEGP